MVETNGKTPTLKNNMFPMLVLQKLSSNGILNTQSFFNDFERTDSYKLRIQPRDFDKWRLESIRNKLRQMYFRGLIKRVSLDQWEITEIGKQKLQWKLKINQGKDIKVAKSKNLQAM